MNTKLTFPGHHAGIKKSNDVALDNGHLTLDILPSGWRRVIRCDELDSTQLEAGRRIGAGEDLAGVIICAERQLAGRGRLDHAWSSEAGGLYITAGLPYDLALKPTDIGWVSLIAAHAAAETLRLDWDFKPCIKWPNDLIVQGRKVGGLLGEVKILQGHRRQILIGMGLNWGNAISLADPGGATAPPGSLIDLRPDLPAAGRDAFLVGWLERLNGWHDRLQRDYNTGLGMLRRSVESLLWRRGERVILKHTERGPMAGRLIGLGAGAAARLEIEPGQVIEAHCGWQVE